ncbi:hypothetical protein ABZY34_32475 [Streptomyces virginiae]|uniref:hypothetical protein n=1 Tax=Streptomyces virginiae TaxID=1961 RepID=UPI0033B683C6
MSDRRTGLLRALAHNTAAPADVLLRLLGHEDERVRREVARRAVLPQEVIEAVLVHPDRRVRMAFAENGDADPEQRARLVDDPSPVVPLMLAAGPMSHRQPDSPLPDRAYERLLDHPEDGVRHELFPARLPRGRARRPLRRLPGSPCAGAWPCATPVWNPHSSTASPGTRGRGAPPYATPGSPWRGSVELLDDPDPGTAAAAAANSSLPPGDMRRLPDRAQVPEIRVNDRTSGC